MTDPGDKASLISFKSALVDAGGAVLAGWMEATDPCRDTWAGVVCDCSQIRSTEVSNCTGDAPGAAYTRVRALDLGPLNTALQPLQGDLSAALGGLEELLLLDLSENKLVGTVPSGLASLSKLQFLDLGGNQLYGTMPGFLGTLKSLKSVGLQSNLFAGPLPEGWCSNNATYSVQANANLCGVVPACLEARGVSGPAAVAGTFLLPPSNLFLETGGYCDDSPPTCDLDVGCRVMAPPFYTAVGTVSFNFTGFVDANSGPLTYSWGVGTAPGVTDVLRPIPYNGTDAVRKVRLRDTSEKLMRWYQVVHYMSSLTLVEGTPYYITVTATNRAGPRLSFSASSTGVVMDTSPPLAGAVYNTEEWQQSATTNKVRHLAASWDDFQDPQSGIRGYYVQFWQQLGRANASDATNSSGSGGVGFGGDDDVEGGMLVENMTDLIDVGLKNKLRYPMRNTLNDSTQYFVRVSAVNRAGLNITVSGLPIRVDMEGGLELSIGTVALIIVLVSLACLGTGAILAILITRARMHQQRRRDKERAMEGKQIKALMYALMSTSNEYQAGPCGASFTSGMPAAKPSTYEQLKESHEFAFVVTDIESSTELSQQDPLAFQQLQEIHDSIMREGIAKQGGYEIITEGDSFSIAFTSVAAAASFCLDVQYRLLETCWPKRVVRLRSCRAVRGPTGDLIFQGPRVRMGLHWAKQGTVVHRMHHITRHRIFAGPGMQFCQDIGEAAHGGQVVMSFEAWEELSRNMALAGWPVVQLLGLFQLPSNPYPVWLYQLTDVIGKSLQRSFPALRKIRMEWPETNVKMSMMWRLSICSPPELGKEGTLAFVVCRLATYPPGVPALPPPVQSRLEEITLAQAQQFRGYAFLMERDWTREGCIGLAFSDTMDALRFCHAAQMLYMYSYWPPEAHAFFGLSVPSADGRWVFQGPRIAMAIHEDSDFEAMQVNALRGILTPHDQVRLRGPAISFTNALAKLARGGQVMLSEAAWDSVKPIINQHPGAAQVISLGTHVINNEYPAPCLLMEVMPNLLSRRVFRRPCTKAMVEPGYRDAPELGKPMACVFCKVCKPEDAVAAERPDGFHEHIQAYQEALPKFTTLLRKLLLQYEGYECKEPDPGKFTLAFKRLDRAVQWACRLQAELIHVEWPKNLLRMKGCAPVYGPSGELVYRGLRVRVGIAWGFAGSKKPLNTGRADYFGVLANTAARVMGLASPGQVLVELSERPTLEDAGVPPIGDARFVHIPADGWETAPHLLQHVERSVGAAGFFDGPDGAAAAGSGSDEESEEEITVEAATLIEIRELGHFALRGLAHERLVYEAVPPGMTGRHHEIPVEHLGRTPSPSLRSAGSSQGIRQKLDGWVDKGRNTWFLRKLVAGASVSSSVSGYTPGTGILAVHPSGPSSASWRAPSSLLGGARAPAALVGGVEGGDGAADGGSPSPQGGSFLEADLRLRAGSSRFVESPASGHWMAPGVHGSAAGSRQLAHGRGARAAAESPPPGPDGAPLGTRAASLDASTASALGRGPGHASSSSPFYHAAGPGPSSLRVASAPHLDALAPRRGLGSGAAGRARAGSKDGAGGEERAGPSSGGSTMLEDPLIGRLVVPPIRTGALNAELFNDSGPEASESPTTPAAALALANSLSLQRGRSSRHGSFVAGPVGRQNSDLSFTSREGGSNSPGPAYMNNSFIAIACGGDEAARPRGPLQMLHQRLTGGRGGRAGISGAAESPTLPSPQGYHSSSHAHVLTSADAADARNQNTQYVQELVNCYRTMPSHRFSGVPQGVGGAAGEPAEQEWGPGISSSRSGTPGLPSGRGTAATGGQARGAGEARSGDGRPSVHPAGGQHHRGAGARHNRGAGAGAGLQRRDESPQKGESPAEQQPPPLPASRTASLTEVLGVGWPGRGRHGGGGRRGEGKGIEVRSKSCGLTDGDVRADLAASAGEGLQQHKGAGHKGRHSRQQQHRHQQQQQQEQEHVDEAKVGQACQAQETQQQQQEEQQQQQQQPLVHPPSQPQLDITHLHAYRASPLGGCAPSPSTDGARATHRSGGSGSGRSPLPSPGGPRGGGLHMRCRPTVAAEARALVGRGGHWCGAHEGGGAGNNSQVDAGSASRGGGAEASTCSAQVAGGSLSTRSQMCLHHGVQDSQDQRQQQQQQQQQQHSSNAAAGGPGLGCGSPRQGAAQPSPGRSPLGGDGMAAALGNPSAAPPPLTVGLLSQAAALLVGSPKGCPGDPPLQLPTTPCGLLPAPPPRSAALLPRGSPSRPSGPLEQMPGSIMPGAGWAGGGPGRGPAGLQGVGGPGVGTGAAQLADDVEEEDGYGTGYAMGVSESLGALQRPIPEMSALEGTAHQEALGDESGRQA